MTEGILFEIPENPLPPGGHAGYFHSRDGKRIRFARFQPSAEPHKGTVVLLSGRNECIEKYFETIGDLTSRGFTVAMTDWRGQGGSARLLRNPARGHIRHFRDYVGDIRQFFEEEVLVHCPGPYYVLAHSTGGLIALLATPYLSGKVRRMVLSAPLLSLYGFPISMRAIRFITGFFRLTGLGWLYAAGGPRKLIPFAGNVLTSDPARYERNSQLISAWPQLGMGGPTAAWVNRVCQAVDTVMDPDFMARIDIPILFVAAGADRVVSTPVTEKYARGLRSGSLVTIDGARHEILQEADLYREQLLAAFDAFIPGSDPAAIQPATAATEATEASPTGASHHLPSSS